MPPHGPNSVATREVRVCGDVDESRNIFLRQEVPAATEPGHEQGRQPVAGAHSRPIPANHFTTVEALADENLEEHTGSVAPRELGGNGELAPRRTVKRGRQGDPS